MPTKRCSWGICNSDSRYNDRPHMVGVTFYPFVKRSVNLDRCRLWVERCGRPESELSVDKIHRHHYICSKHFPEGVQDPIAATYQGFDVSTSRSSRKTSSSASSASSNIHQLSETMQSSEVSQPDVDKAKPALEGVDIKRDNCSTEIGTNCTGDANKPTGNGVMDSESQDAGEITDVTASGESVKEINEVSDNVGDETSEISEEKVSEDNLNTESVVVDAVDNDGGGGDTAEGNTTEADMVEGSDNNDTKTEDSNEDDSALVQQVPAETDDVNSAESEIDLIPEGEETSENEATTNDAICLDNTLDTVEDIDNTSAKEPEVSLEEKYEAVSDDNDDQCDTMYVDDSEEAAVSESNINNDTEETNKSETNKSETNEEESAAAVDENRSEDQEAAMDITEDVREDFNVTEDSNVATDIAEDSNVGTDNAEDSHVATDITEDSNVATDIAEDSNVATDIAEDSNVATDIAEDSNVATDIAEDSNVATDIAEDSNVVTDIAEDSNVATDNAEDSNVATDIAEDSNVATDIAEDSNVVTDIAEDSNVATDNAEDSNVATDITEDSNVATDNAEDSNVATDITEDSPEVTEESVQASAASSPVISNSDAMETGKGITDGAEIQQAAGDDAVEPVEEAIEADEESSGDAKSLSATEGEVSANAEDKSEEPEDTEAVASEEADTGEVVLTANDEESEVNTEQSPLSNEVSETQEGATDEKSVVEGKDDSNEASMTEDDDGAGAGKKEVSDTLEGVNESADEKSNLEVNDDSNEAVIEKDDEVNEIKIGETSTVDTAATAKESKEDSDAEPNSDTKDVDTEQDKGKATTTNSDDDTKMDIETIEDSQESTDVTESGKDTVRSGSSSGHESDNKSSEPAELGIKIAAVTGAADMDVVSEKKEDSKEDVKNGETNHKVANSTKKPVKDVKNGEDNVITLKDKKPTKPKGSAKIQKCIVCFKTVKCKYNIVRNGDVKHLCDDVCFKKFKQSPTTYLRQAGSAQTPETTKEPSPVSNSITATNQIKASAATTTTANSTVRTPSYKTCNVCQLMNVRTSKPFLNWLGQDYCGEECLGKFQSGISTSCAFCSSNIVVQNKARWVSRVGNDVKGFCGGNCLTEFNKRMKICAFCNKDLLKVKDSFMAPVGSQGMFKDFCSQTCLQKFEDKNQGDEAANQKSLVANASANKRSNCAVCAKFQTVKHQFKLENRWINLCSDPCLSAFQYANKLTLNKCDSCCMYLNDDSTATQCVQFEGQQKRFCSYMCVNSFKNNHAKVVPCSWCGARKTNFDMIERVDASSKYQLFCSLSCLSLYRVNLQATSNQAVVCDQCRKFVPAQYHLTMSDASVRNFCSYGCVMQFQAQFQSPKTSQPQQQQQQQQPAAAAASKQPVTSPQATTRSGRVVKGAAAAVMQQQQYQQTSSSSVAKSMSTADTGGSIPVISNVMSLAQPTDKTPGKQPVVVKQSSLQPAKSVTTIQQQIIIQPPPPKAQKNKAVMCKPVTLTKAASCRPHTQTKDMQTEGKPEPDKIFIPVPVPIYCPTPLPMYSLPTPIMIPVPVPIPVPVFIPTTKKSAAAIMKQIKEIQERIPADPLEAELLMMAEAVAGKDEESSSDSDEAEPETEEVKESPRPKEPTPVPAAPAPSSGDVGEDMLQMALRMASEMSDEPVMDLEASLEPVAVNPVPPSAPPVVNDIVQDEDEEYVPARQTRRGGRAGVGSGNKRQSRSTPRRNTKRQKVEPQPELRETKPETPPQPAAPPPDANFHLKYTYGLNAFKHWVLQKNTTIEQLPKPSPGRPPKLFKMDILQCTADELNYALCLFVKEVRKPNGEEYAVDSIYYLCLGIQQYLFESGRIDNIFTDIYYEQFTEGLNEILTRYEPKLNHAGQLVCRIEEEHLWESKQLGAHSPHVLLNSLVYFNTKYFMLKTSEDHLKLSFTHIMKHWKKTASGRGSGTGPNAGRSVYLRYYCPATQSKDNNAHRKKKEEMPVYEQTENLDNPLRCPVKLYEFYLSKCPESIKNRNDTFYLVPERSCVPDSPVWYSTSMLGIDQMAKMLNRVRLVREIQEAHLHTQPTYI